jgi:hypothetical protein
MNRIALLLLFFAGNCWAHPGHGAPLFHAHPPDGYLLLGAAAIVVSLILARRSK